MLVSPVVTVQSLLKEPWFNVSQADYMQLRPHRWIDLGSWVCVRACKCVCVHARVRVCVRARAGFEFPDTICQISLGD